MSKTDEYRAKLQALDSWDSYLLEESGLPGPRGNLELAQVVADEGDLKLFRRYISYTADQAPVNSPYEFLAFCGVVGLGRLLAEGDTHLLKTLRIHASDLRWRMLLTQSPAKSRIKQAQQVCLLYFIARHLGEYQTYILHLAHCNGHCSEIERRWQRDKSFKLDFLPLSPN